MRLTFFISTAISTVGPYLGWYGLCVWYVYDAAVNPYDENGTPYEDVMLYITWYIYVKVFLTIAVTCINTWLTHEFVKPIYDWW